MAKFAKFAVAAILVTLLLIILDEIVNKDIVVVAAAFVLVPPVFCHVLGMREKKSGWVAAVIGSVLFWGIFAILIKDCVVGTRTCIGFRIVVREAILIWLLSIVPFFNFRWTSIGFDWLENFILGSAKLIAGGLNFIAQKGRKSDSEK